MPPAKARAGTMSCLRDACPRSATESARTARLPTREIHADVAYQCARKESTLPSVEDLTSPKTSADVVHPRSGWAQQTPRLRTRNAAPHPLLGRSSLREWDTQCPRGTLFPSAAGFGRTRLLPSKQLPAAPGYQVTSAPQMFRAHDAENARWS